jgi:hypothetical protein
MTAAKIGLDNKHDGREICPFRSEHAMNGMHKLDLHMID